MEKKIYTYKEYLDEDKHKEVETTYPAAPTDGVETQESSTNNYPVPTTAVMPQKDDKIIYYVKSQLEETKSNAPEFFPAIFLNMKF